MSCDMEPDTLAVDYTPVAELPLSPPQESSRTRLETPPCPHAHLHPEKPSNVRIVSGRGHTVHNDGATARLCVYTYQCDHCGMHWSETPPHAMDMFIKFCRKKGYNPEDYKIKTNDVQIGRKNKQYMHKEKKVAATTKKKPKTTKSSKQTVIATPVPRCDPMAMLLLATQTGELSAEQAQKAAWSAAAWAAVAQAMEARACAVAKVV